MARKEPIPREWTDRLARRFAVLAVPARLDLVNRLLSGGEQCVQQLAEATDQRQPSASKHLAVLNREGLVARRRQGSRVVYRVEDPTLIAVCTLMCGQLKEELSEEMPTGRVLSLAD